jgi:putative restriction endonuclease
VQDVEDGGPDKVANGLLLRADLHRLFDRGYFSIERDGSVCLHPNLSSRYANELRGARLSDETLQRIEAYLWRRKRRTPESH